MNLHVTAAPAPLDVRSAFENAEALRRMAKVWDRLEATSRGLRGAKGPAWRGKKCPR
jgi:hypothetical protein